MDAEAARHRAALSLQISFALRPGGGQALQRRLLGAEGRCGGSGSECALALVDAVAALRGIALRRRFDFSSCFVPVGGKLCGVGCSELKGASAAAETSALWRLRMQRLRGSALRGHFEFPSCFAGGMAVARAYSGGGLVSF